MQNFQYFQPQTELFNEAAQSVMDYSAKAFARQTAFAHQFVGRDLSVVEASDSAQQYADFAEEAAEDWAQATERHCDLWERAVVGAVAQTQAWFPGKSDAHNQQMVAQVKTANAAVKNGVRAAANGAASAVRSAASGGVLNGGDKTENTGNKRKKR